MRRGWKWLRAYAAAVLWAGVLAGLIGFVEGVVQWARFGGWTAGGGEAGFVRSVAPTVTLSSWFAMGLAALLFPPYAVVLGRRPSARRLCFAFATGSALAALAFVYAGYLGREHLWTAWWPAHELRAALLLQVAVYVVVAVALVRPLSVLADSLVLTPRRNLFLAVVFLVVFTSLWPNWRDEGFATRCGGIERVADAPHGPNVVLVTIDAWRRDRLGALSPDAPPTPHLDALAGEGLLYPNAWSSSCWTLPGEGTLMTGRDPRALGMRRHQPLPPGAATLAETAWRAGWCTAAFATNPFLSSAYGFDRGFAEFEHANVLEPLLPAERSVLARELTWWVDRFVELDAGEYVVGKALRWLPHRPADRPFLLWLHLLDAHLPYRWQRLPGDPEPPALPDDPLFSHGALPAAALAAVRERAAGLTPAVRDAIAALYDSEVRYADHQLGRLFEALHREGLWDDTLIVVTADHGEELFDHGGFEHGHSFLPEVGAVPLIVKLPAGGAAGLTIARDVASRDLLPSLCRELGWTPPSDLPGRDDLWPAAADAEPATRGSSASAPVVMENRLYGEGGRAVRAWPLFRVESGDGSATWYDLAADPAAMRPLPAPPARADAILAAADSLSRADDAESARLGIGDGPLPGPDAELRRQLRSLGY